MGELKACVKKEYLECIRGKRMWIYFGLAIGLFLVTIGMMYLMNFLLEIMSNVSGGDESMGMENMFALNASTSAYMYNSNMLQIFVLAVIFVLMGSVSKEIKTKKWILPVCSGIKPSKMVYAKFIVQVGFACVSALAGFCLNAGFSAIFMKNDVPFSSIALAGLSMVLTVGFMSIITISLSALTKNSAIACAVPIIVILVLPMVFMVLEIINYTPLFFYSYSTNIVGQSFKTVEVVVSSLTTVGISGLLIWLSAFMSDKFVKIN